MRKMRKTNIAWILCAFACSCAAHRSSDWDFRENSIIVRLEYPDLYRIGYAHLDMQGYSGMRKSILINHNSIRADVSLEHQLGGGSPLAAQFMFLRPSATFYATRRLSLSHREWDYYGLDVGVAGTGDTPPFSASVGISYGRARGDLSWNTGLGYWF